MSDGEPFSDYYSILEVSPNCDAKTLESAYRNLAKIYHPDHPNTADVTKFEEVIRAYRALRNADDRADYDLRFAQATGFEFSSGNKLYDNEDELFRDEKFAISDSYIHKKILLLLYIKRREQAMDAGVGQYHIQEMLNCSDDQFAFHQWYLKAKGFIEITEQGTLAITIEGVDHVISMSRTDVRERLLLPQAIDPEAQEKS